MFTRIRNAALILSAPTERVPAHEIPDITFEDVKPQEVSRAGKAIAKLAEIVLLSCILGYFSANALAYVFAQKHASVGFAAGISSLCTFIIIQCYDRITARISYHLRIAEKLAPYFGRRLARSYKILRG